MLKCAQKQLAGNWLSALALWTIIAAWAACGIYGWMHAADGVMRWICIALNIGCAVFAARAVKNTKSSVRPALLYALGAACLLFDGWSGAQGLSVSEGARWAPYDAYLQEKVLLDQVDAKLDQVRPVPLSDEAGRVIGPIRFRELGAQRQAEIARLVGMRAESLRKVAESPAKPAPRMPWALEAAIAGLVALLELLGFATIAGKSATQQADNVVDISAAARAMVGRRKDRQPT